MPVSIKEACASGVVYATLIGMRVCSIADCGAAIGAKNRTGLCDRCYMREYQRARAKDVVRAPRVREKRAQYKRSPETKARERAAARARYWADPLRSDRQKCAKYEISLGGLFALRMAQEGRCAMPGCSAVLSGKNEHVDHDHSTGIVRGLLCGSCNNSLGHWEKLKGRAESYLERACP